MSRRPPPTPRGGGSTLSARSVRTRTHPHPARGRPRHRARARARRRRRPRSTGMPCTAASAARSTGCGVPNSVSKCSGRSACGQEREDPAAAVVDHDERRRRSPRSAAPSSPLLSCRKQRSPSSATVGAVVGRGRDAERGRHEPVDAVDPAVGVEGDALARGGEALDVAHRHARRDHERRVRGRRGHDVARDPPFERRRPSVDQPVDRRCGRHRRRGATVRTQSSSTITSTASASAPRRSSGSATMRPLAAWWGSSHASSGSTSTWSTLGSSHWSATLLVVGAPTRSTTSGRWASANPGIAQQRVVGGDGAGHAQVRERVGEHRPAGGLGEAQHGRGPDAGAPAGDDEAPGPVGHEVRERVEHLDRGCRTPGACAVHGRSSERPGASTSVVTRRHERLAERQVEVHRPGGRPERLGHRPRRERAPLGTDTGSIARARRLVEPAHRVAVQLHLVDGLPRAGVAQLGRPVGGAHDHRDPPVVRLEHRRVEVRRRGARRAQQRRRASGRARDAESEERRRPLVEDARAHGRGRRRASASASGADREPGARHASVTPWRTHSSTSVRAKAVVASRRHGRMPP